MRTMRHTLVLVMSLSMLLCGLAAWSSAAHPSTSAAQRLEAGFRTLPARHTYNGLPYWSGGVGELERRAMSEMAQDCNLRLVFALRDGVYLADVPVMIQDSMGKEVLKVTSEGPWLFTKLPAGTYLVTAEFEGKIQEQKVSVDRQDQTPLQFSW